MLAATPVRIIDQWRSVYNYEPWGEDRTEELHGILCALIDARHRTSGGPARAIDFMPYHPSKRQKATTTAETLESQKKLWASAAAAWNATAGKKMRGK